MYKVGDLVVYGGTGVCRITDITARTQPGIDQEVLYYVLSPLYQDYTIFSPVHNKKVFMRPIITKSEAEQLIDTIPDIHAEAYHNRTISQLIDHYKATLESHDCSDLLELCMSIHEKKQTAEKQNKRLGAVDAKFMKRAENLLFGELAAALGIESEQVPEYIDNRINRHQKCNCNECNN